jgi:hypothetical protein
MVEFVLGCMETAAKAMLGLIFLALIGAIGTAIYMLGAKWFWEWRNDVNRKKLRKSDIEVKEDNRCD